MAGNNLVEFLNEVLQPLGTVRSKKMFGGFGVYCDGVMFGLIADDILYLKADDINKGMFEAEGQGRFVYEGQTRPVTMSYWRRGTGVLLEPLTVDRVGEGGPGAGQRLNGYRFSAGTGGNDQERRSEEAAKDGHGSSGFRLRAYGDIPENISTVGHGWRNNVSRLCNRVTGRWLRGLHRGR